MILISLSRILKFAAQDFIRNFWISIVTVTILILSLFSINFLIVAGVISEAAIKTVEQKIDLSLYLSPTAAEEDISALKKELENLDGVAEVEYVSKTQALESFQQKHKDNNEVQDALREIGDNPLNPSFVVKAELLSDYERIINSLDKLNKHTIIESRNFDNHKLLLESMNNITAKTRQAGMLISFIFVAIPHFISSKNLFSSKKITQEKKEKVEYKNETLTKLIIKYINYLDLILGASAMNIFTETLSRFNKTYDDFINDDISTEALIEIVKLMVDKVNLAFGKVSNKILYNLRTEKNKNIIQQLIKE